MNEPARRVYSARRLRIVIALLSIIFLPLVIGASLLIYQYLRMSVLVEQRLSGEKGRLPARVYARPLLLRPGMVLAPDELVQVLNRLRYAERELPAEAGQFAVSPAGVSFFPRPVLDGAEEPLLVSFATDKQKVTRVREIRARSKKRVAEQALEPELVSYLYGEDREKRRRVRYEELPDHMVKAVLAIEDRRFFSHPGLDPIRLLGAGIRNLRSDSAIPHGGSTITQQLCKNFFLRTTDERGFRSAERSYKRKAQEALLAFVLERRASKQEILEMYLNEVYLGQSGSFGINGVGEAARSYFGKDVTNLTLPEAALIAGMIQSPNPYNPFRHEKRATERRNEVVRAMQDAGFIDEGGDGGGAPGAAARRAAERRHHGRALLRGPGGPAARRALRGAGPDHAEPLDLHDARPAPAGARPAGARARARPRPGADQEAHHGARAGQHDRDRAGERAAGGARRVAARTAAASTTA